MTPTTELEAVNEMLATIGEQPVNSLSEGLTADVSMALTTLRSVSRWVQSQGHWFNTDYDYSFALDGGGKAPVSTDIIRASFSRPTYYDKLLVIRDGYVYDTKNSTGIFTSALKADSVTYLLDWENLPETARQYILIRASRLFARRVSPDMQTEQFTAIEEADAKRRMTKDGGQVRDVNILRSPAVQGILRRNLY